MKRAPRQTKRQRKGTERARVTAAEQRAEAQRHNQAIREREARIEAERRRRAAMTQEELEAERARLRRPRSHVAIAIGAVLAMGACVSPPPPDSFE